MLNRRRRTATPAELLEQTRAAQAAHAAAVTDANQRLVESHEAIYNEAASRQETLREQVKLLKAEHDGLEPVKNATAKPPVAGA